MSNHLISEVYKRQIGNIARKAVMVLMADKASDDGTGIWASKQRMADELGASKQTVISTIKGLISDGLIREAGQRKCSNGFTVEYAINIKALRSYPVLKCHLDDQSENLTGQNALPVKDFDPTSQAALPDQSNSLTQTPLNPPEPSKRKTNRAHVIPDDWQPLTFSSGTKCWEIMAQWPPGEIEAQVEHFTAHHRGKGSRFVDWQDAWKTWVLNSRKWNNGKHGGSANANRKAQAGGGIAAALDRRLGLGEPSGEVGRYAAGTGGCTRALTFAPDDPMR